MVSCASFGTFAGNFTQHSNIFLYFVTLMSLFHHHPFILCPQLFVLVSLSRERRWKSSFFSVCVQISFLVFQITQFSVSLRMFQTRCGRLRRWGQTRGRGWWVIWRGRRRRYQGSSTHRMFQTRCMQLASLTYRQIHTVLSVLTFVKQTLQVFNVSTRHPWVFK